MTKIRPAQLTRAFFAADDRGVVGIIFGLAILPVTMVIGVAIDYSRLTTARSALQQGTDAAVLKAATTLTSRSSSADVRKQVAIAMRTNPQFANATVDDASVSSDRSQVCASTSVGVQNAFMRIIGLATSTVGASACAQPASSDSFEIAVVLDISGSMDVKADATQTKIQALRATAGQFVTDVFARNPGNVRVSVVPYSATVAAVDPANFDRSQSWIDQNGDSAAHWLGFGGSKDAASKAGFRNRFEILAELKKLDPVADWRGCFEEPVYPYNTRTNFSSADSLMLPYIVPDEPGGIDMTMNPYASFYEFNYLPDTSSNCTGGEPATFYGKLDNVCKYKGQAKYTPTPTPHMGVSNPSPNWGCPSYSTQGLVRLTSDSNKALDRIKNMPIDNWTNIHTGLMWGWRTLAPGAPFADGAAYATSGLRKIIVLMTDGYNDLGAWDYTALGSRPGAEGFETYNGVSNPRFPDGTGPFNTGQNWQQVLNGAAKKNAQPYFTQSAPLPEYVNPWARYPVDELTLEACANARTAGIEIFTIAFDSDPAYNKGRASMDPVATSLMQKCATNADHFFYANDPVKLATAFQSIRSRLERLRLTQ